MNIIPDHKFRPVSHPVVSGLRAWPLAKGGFALSVHLVDTGVRITDYYHLTRQEMKEVAADYLNLMEGESPLKVYKSHIKRR